VVPLHKWFNLAVLNAHCLMISLLFPVATDYQLWDRRQLWDRQQSWDRWQLWAKWRDASCIGLADALCE